MIKKDAKPAPKEKPKQEDVKFRGNWSPQIKTPTPRSFVPFAKTASPAKPISKIKNEIDDSLKKKNQLKMKIWMPFCH